MADREQEGREADRRAQEARAELRRGVEGLGSLVWRPLVALVSTFVVASIAHGAPTFEIAMGAGAALAVLAMLEAHHRADRLRSYGRAFALCLVWTVAWAVCLTVGLSGGRSASPARFAGLPCGVVLYLWLLTSLALRAGRLVAPAPEPKAATTCEACGRRRPTSAVGFAYGIHAADHDWGRSRWTFTEKGTAEVRLCEPCVLGAPHLALVWGYRCFVGFTGAAALGTLVTSVVTLPDPLPPPLRFLAVVLVLPGAVGFCLASWGAVQSDETERLQMREELAIRVKHSWLREQGMRGMTTRELESYHRP